MPLRRKAEPGPVGSLNLRRCVARLWLPVLGRRVERCPELGARPPSVRCGWAKQRSMRMATLVLCPPDSKEASPHCGLVVVVMYGREGGPRVTWGSATLKRRHATLHLHLPVSQMVGPPPTDASEDHLEQQVAHHPMAVPAIGWGVVKHTPTGRSQ
jgi:hypothetical protein